MTANVYDRFGQEYNVTQVISPGQTLDEQAYIKYSPPFLPATFAFVYGLSFASITAVLVHVYLWHWTDIRATLQNKQKDDIHSRLMRAYRRVPWWWYGVLTIVMFVLSVVMVEVYHTKLPVYGVLLALCIPAVYIIPCGIIQGITNVNANQLNVAAEFIGGYMFAGRPLANMIFKILSEDVVSQALTFSSDQKLGHYLKVPPRLLFFAQGGATVSGACTISLDGMTDNGIARYWGLSHLSESRRGCSGMSALFAVMINRMDSLVPTGEQSSPHP